jgi:HAD superfamily hydrolase (TIGR01549 family)
MQWEAVFWDFDGVILDSVNVKTEAFAQIFHKYGLEVERAVVDYHLKHAGISRYEKFRYYYEEILEIPITEDVLTKLGNEFSQLVLQKVIDSPFMPGALESLQALKADKVPSYIVSGTPEEEMNHIVDTKSLRTFFNEVHGAPRKKTDIVCEILQQKHYTPDQCLFIGDAMTDYEAAKKNDLLFIGIVQHGHTNPFPPDTQIYSSVNLKV